MGFQVICESVSIQSCPYEFDLDLTLVDCNTWCKYRFDTGKLRHMHSGETDEANCSWLHPVWPPPKRPDQDNTFCAVSGAPTELIFCIHRDFDIRNNVCKPRRLVCGYCRDMSA